MLIILQAFNDSSPLQSWVGNLDNILGGSVLYWHAMEVAYPLSAILVFLFYGKINLVRNPSMNLKLKASLVFIIFLTLLSLDDLDDILRVLGSHISLGANYLLAMELLYPVGAIITFLSFGTVCSKVNNKQPA